MAWSYRPPSNPSKSCAFGFNGSYTDPTFNNAVAGIGAQAGDRLPNIPEFQGAITVDYYLPLRGGWNSHFGAGLRMVGDRKSAPESGGSTPGTDLAYPLGSYAALDLNADIYNKNWTVRIFVKNVTDERAYQTINPVSSEVTGAVDHLNGVPIPPRTVGIEVDYRF